MSPPPAITRVTTSRSIGVPGWRRAAACWPRPPCIVSPPMPRSGRCSACRACMPPSPRPAALEDRSRALRPRSLPGPRGDHRLGGAPTRRRGGTFRRRSTRTPQGDARLRRGRNSRRTRLSPLTPVYRRLIFLTGSCSPPPRARPSGKGECTSRNGFDPSGKPSAMRALDLRTLPTHTRFDHAQFPPPCQDHGAHPAPGARQFAASPSLMREPRARRPIPEFRPRRLEHPRRKRSNAPSCRRLPPAGTAPARPRRICTAWAPICCGPARSGSKPSPTPRPSAAPSARLRIRSMPPTSGGGDHPLQRRTERRRLHQRRHLDACRPVEPRRQLRFDNLQSRLDSGPLTGSFDWTTREIVLDVPHAADKILYGVMLIGTGTTVGAEHRRGTRRHGKG